ncbi:Endonuclease/exonuclease/phosphatase, partial [Earliella scabrosa]
MREGLPPLPSSGGQCRSKHTKTRAKLKIASLNMRGGGPVGGPQDNDKWLLLNQLMRDRRIAVMALQETHLTEDRLGTLHELFGDVMDIVCSPDPTNPTGARGVAVAVNKRILPQGVEKWENIVPGRALKAAVRMKEDAYLEVLAVYAPNEPTNNARFWEHLRLDDRSACDVLLGDLNLVEDAIDRLPHKRDDPSATGELARFREKHGLVDGWRHENENVKAFTYLQTATGSQSRLDRIYFRCSLIKMTVGWDIVDPGIPTDHRMPVCELANFRLPFVGRGRWTLPTGLLRNKEFISEVCETGRELERSLDQAPNDGEGVQRLYQAFKEGIKSLAQEWAKRSIPKLDRRIGKLKDELKEVLKEPVEDVATAKAADLQKRLTRLEERRFGQKRAAVRAKDWAEGETLSKYWTRSN